MAEAYHEKQSKKTINLFFLSSAGVLIIIFTLLSIAVYFLLVYLFIGKVGYDVIFFLIIPAVVSSALMGLNIGLITTALIPVATIGMNYLFGDGSTNFISKYIAGTIVNLVAAFTIGRLRDMHMKLLMETDKRLEVETDKAKHVKSVRQLETRAAQYFRECFNWILQNRSYRSNNNG